MFKIFKKKNVNKKETKLADRIDKAKQQGDFERANHLTKLSETLDKLDTRMEEERKSDQAEWRKGFLSGYGSAVTGIVLGVVAVKLINEYSGRNKTNLNEN